MKKQIAALVLVPCLLAVAMDVAAQPPQSFGPAVTISGAPSQRHSSWTATKAGTTEQEMTFQLGPSNQDNYGSIEATHTFTGAKTAAVCATARLHLVIQKAAGSGFTPFYDHVATATFANGKCTARTGAIVYGGQYKVDAHSTAVENGKTVDGLVTLTGDYSPGPNNLLNPQKW